MTSISYPEYGIWIFFHYNSPRLIIAIWNNVVTVLKELKVLPDILY